MAEPIGAFTFVLHSHLPYARRAGRWPHGEEWIHEAASETYLPLLQALTGLRDRGVRYHLTIGLTPILCEQLADATVIRNLAAFMEEKEVRAKADIARFEKGDEAWRQGVATWYYHRYQDLRRYFDSIDRNILGVFRRLQEQELVEIGTSAATHGYLPLMDRDSTIHAQLAVGVQSYVRHFGRAPRACWLPECAYRPAYIRTENGKNYLRPGLETFLAEQKLRVFFAETHTVEGGTPVGKAAGDAVGPYGEIRRRYVVPTPDYQPPTDRTTFQPYWVSAPEVAVMARNSRTGLQVWSASHGYPGEADYREFHKRDGVSGLQYWRVTGPDVDLGDKGAWNPKHAWERVGTHANHFSGLVEAELAGYRERSGKRGILVAAYDTELFGHWWFEGVDWIAGVLERLAKSPTVETCTAGGYVTVHPPEEVLALPESSWGQAGNHFTWLNADTEWMWPIIHRCERRMERIVELYIQPDEDLAPVLNQCARELLLLESSDWPFLVTTGQAREYAIERFENHVARFERLASIAEAGQAGEAELAVAHELWELDRVFPDIDYRVFARREPVPAGP